MIETSTNKKRIARNAAALYVRMIFSTLVSLYTSRVVLSTLGVVDYGIYGVVGSVVTMLSFLNSSMSGATSRFLTFEIGLADPIRIQKTFSAALIVHILIALIILLLSETIGLWFLVTKLVIPENQRFAAHVVYQFSILSAILGVTQVPYNACIIAHERMHVFAYIEIINVLAKLLIVYLLVIGNFNKLILYSFLVFIVSFGVMMIYRTYCIKKFPECKFSWHWDPTYIKPLLSFSGWDLYGNLSCTINQQGTNFLINMFFGVVYNAANGIANTVTSVIRNFCNNILMAFRPQIIKLYSVGEVQQSVNLLYQACKFSTTLLIVLALPLIFEMDYVMILWLKTPPPYSSIFCRILLINACFTMLEWSLSIGIHATGKIRAISLWGGTCFLLCVPITWLFYKLGYPVETAYLISIPNSILVVFVKTVIYKKYVPQFSYWRFITKVLLPISFLTTILIVCLASIFFNFDNNLFRLFLIIITDIIVSGLFSYFLIMNRTQRLAILNFLKRQSITRN